MILISQLKRYQGVASIVVSWAMLVTLLMLPESGILAVSLLSLLWGYVLGTKWPLLLAVAMLISVHGINSRVKRLNIRWLEWSPLSTKANLSLLPLSRKWSGIGYAVVLAFCIPLMAWFEELIFRHVNDDLSDKLLWGGLVFGAAHLLALVTIRMAITLSLLGLVLVLVYEHAGLIGAFAVHASYNLITLSVIIFEMRIRGPLGEWLLEQDYSIRHFPTLTPWLLKSSSWYA